jgi:hypothetical protein
MGNMGLFPRNLLTTSATFPERSGPERSLEVLEVCLQGLFQASPGAPVSPGRLAAGLASDVALGLR